MMLINEVLLDILHFLDYSSLLRTKFACSIFRSTIVRNQEILASSPILRLSMKSADVRIEKMPFTARSSAIASRNNGSRDVLLAAAVVAAALNPITIVKVWCEAVTSGASNEVLSAIPAANYASDLRIHRIDKAHTSNA